MFLYEALENRYISWGFFFFLFSSWVLLFCYFILADSLTSCCCTCVHGCLGHPGASAASPPGVRGWEWLWTGDCKTRQQGKKLPHGWEEWAPSPSLLPPPAHQAAGTCERGAWGTACLDHSCPQRETSLITFISLSKNMNVFFFIEARKHPLNIHVSLLSESDMNLALMDRKCSGQLFGMNVEKRQPQWTSI